MISPSLQSAHAWPLTGLAEREGGGRGDGLSFLSLVRAFLHLNEIVVRMDHIHTLQNATKWSFAG